MSSTNKTTNYELSQYVGSDKPTYLGDYNSDMAKIDAQMKRNADGITTVDAKATTAGTNASTALTNAATAQTSADSAQTSANQANNTATSALAKATTNESKILSLESAFNFTNIKEYTGSQITVNNNSFTPTGTGNNYKITVATNEDGSLAKIYGKLTGTASNTELVNISIQSDLRPSSNITINPNGLIRRDNGNLIGTCPIDIETDGTIRFRAGGVGGFNIELIYLPMLFLIKDFGDTNQ